MSIDTKALDNAADTFSRSMRALNSMELADLPPELDQDARDLARIIQEHGKDYVGTEYGDMTAPLLESLARLVQAAKAADRLAALDEQLHLTNVDALQAEAERNELASELRQAMDERDAAQAEARELRAEIESEEKRFNAQQDLLYRVINERDVLQFELARVRELPAKWRAAPQNPDEPLLAMAADELDAALSQAAEQHDPLAVSDHCGECGEPEPECACDERIEDCRESGQEGR